MTQPSPRSSSEFFFFTKKMDDKKSEKIQTIKSRVNFQSRKNEKMKNNSKFLRKTCTVRLIISVRSTTFDKEYVRQTSHVGAKCKRRCKGAVRFSFDFGS